MVIPVYFVSGCAVSESILFVATMPDDLRDGDAFTRLYYLNISRDEPWAYVDWPDRNVVSVCLKASAAGQRRAGCSLTGEGHVEIANSDAALYEKIEGAGLEDGSRLLGELTSIKEIGSTLFACGGGGQVYRRDADGWRAIDEPLVAEARSIREEINKLRGSSVEVRMLEGTRLTKRIPNFTHIEGISEDDFYVCGIGGGLYHFDSGTWSRLDSGTDRVLNSIYCASRSDVWVVGQDGIVLRGNATMGFRLIGQLLPGDHFWNICAFRGEIYVGSSQGLFRLDRSSRMRAVREDGLDGSTRIVTLDAFGDEALWVTSERHAYRYDGATFLQHRHGDNG